TKSELNDAATRVGAPGCRREALMSDGRATKQQEAAHESFLRRQAEVTQQDHAEFSQYLQEKSARDERLKVQWAEPPARSRSLLKRRNILTLAAGTAVVGEAVTLGYPLVSGQSTASTGTGSAVLAQAQRQPIERELINPQADVGGKRFGDWVLLMPTKM